MHYIHIIYTRELLLDDFTVFDKIILPKNNVNISYLIIFHVLNLYSEEVMSQRILPKLLPTICNKKYGYVNYSHNTN